MIDFLKHIWRYFHSYRLKKHNVIIPHNVLFNKNSTFESNIKVAKGVCISNSTIGRNTYIGPNTNLPNCKIGRFCSIADNVTIVDSTHPAHYVSTCPSFFSAKKQNCQTFVDQECFNEQLRIGQYSLIIGNDVWIGSHVIIKGGVTIGDGAIIGMGAIITTDIPPYAIAVGVPAKVIKYRFDNSIINQLQQIEWWNKPDDWFIKNADSFQDINVFLKNNKI